MGDSDLKLRTKEYALKERWDGRVLPKERFERSKAVERLERLERIHCEQGIFVSIVINTKAKSKPPNLNSLSPIYPSSFRLYPFVQGLS